MTTYVYRRAHRHVSLIHGPASGYPCITCGNPAKHWAYQYTDPSVCYDAEGRPYSNNPSHYSPMCIGCHRRFDIATDPVFAEKVRANGRRMGLDCQERLRTDAWFADRRRQEQSAIMRRINTAPEYASARASRKKN